MTRMNTLMALAAAVGSALPFAGGYQGPRPKDSWETTFRKKDPKLDKQRIEAAQAKRDRKAAKRLAQLNG